MADAAVPAIVPTVLDEAMDFTLIATNPEAKIFDRLGVLPRVRRPDSVVCGEILFPNQTVHRWGQLKTVTFFVAWWLDTKTL